MNAAQRVAIARQINDINKRKRWPLFWATVGSFMVAAGMISTHGGNPLVIGMLLSLGFFLIISGTLFFNIAYWDLKELDKCDDGIRPEPPSGTTRGDTLEGARRKARRSIPVSGNSSDVLLFDENKPGHALIVKRSANVLLKCRYSEYIDMAQWATLLDLLARNDWKWTQSVLRDSRIFVQSNIPEISITRSGDYQKVCKEFKRLGIIIESGQSYRVRNPVGRWELTRMAGRKHIPDRGGLPHFKPWWTRAPA